MIVSLKNWHQSCHWISFLFFFCQTFSVKKLENNAVIWRFFSLSFFHHQITSHGRKCVRAKAGLNPYDTTAEIVRESCNDPIEESPVLTRLFFKNIQKYVCFDRCGRLRTKVIHDSNSVISPVKTMRLHKILSVTLTTSISKSKILLNSDFRHFRSHTKTETKQTNITLSTSSVREIQSK